jgi:glycosyltransferase involved in cell wall biosynthesis
VPEADPGSRALKRSLLSQARLARRVDALTCRLEFGADQHVEVVDTPAWASARADVSVVVPSHDYAGHVTEALGSVLASVGVTPEIVVVDDHSTDASRVVIERVMNEHPEAAIRLVALHANEGLSAVRNRALEHVRSELVFFLDADNSVYPFALARLRDALGTSDAAMAYGMIEGFGAHRRLISAYPFEERRLVHGNYIDAMVMMRRAVLEEVGGFSTEMQDTHGGWEDYELWLRLAAGGQRAVLVPQIVGRYRVHATSMVSTVNLDVTTVFRDLRDRYPDLPWPTPATVSP